jgi:hypothetical protein
MIKKCFAIGILSLLIPIGSLATSKDEPVIELVAGKPGVFKLRIDPSIKGATISIYSNQGVLVAKQVVSKRKVAIDFSYAWFGLYKIVVDHQNTRREFFFMKNNIHTAQARAD